MLRGYSMVSNGTGGIDWSGLPLVVELLGVADVERFVNGLMVIKRYRAPEKEG